MIRENKSLTKAFRWQSSTLPPKYKTKSVSYFQALEVTLISGLMLGASMFFLLHTFFTIEVSHWIMFIQIGVLTMYFQLSIYKRILK
jgi:F0F1-type ATP synthase assembly protein I